MARYKPYSYEQSKFISIYFDEQLIPGTFEYALNHIVDNELDLTIFLDRYKNDQCGASAYDPAVLLKIIFFAYSHGITSSQKIEACCRNNILFKALSADTVPHFTTIADFISTMEKEITPLFRNVLLICDEMGLIGKEMFAIDGCKLPSNASKEWSGTHAGLAKKKEKLEKVIGHILKRHRLKPMIEKCSENFKVIGKEKEIEKETSVLADSGFHSEANMKYLKEEKIDGYIADNRFRRRDPRFKTADRHKKPIKKEKLKAKYFKASDFKIDKELCRPICPAGNILYLKNSNFVVKGKAGITYMAKQSDCKDCRLRAQCLRRPNTTARQVTFFTGKTEEDKESYTQKMIKKIDTEVGREIYSFRMGLIEPVFANIRSTLRLDRFSLRGKIKVNIQWLLFCITHNLGKIQRYGLQAS